MATKAAVVIPVYKEELNEFEKISLAQVRKVLSNYPLIFLAPEGKTFSYTENDLILYAPQEFFQSVRTYSDLLTSPAFYRAFLSYEYILIYQLDAFVFSDQMEYFCSLGYDYIGAAWSSIFRREFIYRDKVYKVRVGNGGFSLRNVKACCKVFDEHPNIVNAFKGFVDDDFWSFMGLIEESDFHSAPLKIANQFSV